MSLTLEEIVKIAIENQHLILEQELKKGVPLSYLDDNGQYILRYPNGHMETATLPETGKRDKSCPSCCE